MRGRGCSLAGAIGYLLFLFVGAYLSAAILVPSVGGLLRFEGQGRYSVPVQDGDFLITVAAAGVSLLFLALALYTGIFLLFRIGRHLPLCRRRLLAALAGNFGCVFPFLMIPSSVLTQYPYRQPKWPPLPSFLVRQFCREDNACLFLNLLLVFLFMLSLLGAVVAYACYDRKTVRWADTLS